MTVRIKIEDGATPALEELAKRVAPARMAGQLGPRLVRLHQTHFLRNGKNKKGWPTTNFWARAAKATNWQATTEGVDIVVPQIGVRQRYRGGMIRPVKKKFLTIPAVAEAYGKVASDFPGITFKMVMDLESGKMRPALVQKAGTVVGVKKVKRKAHKTEDGGMSLGSDQQITAQATGLVALFWLARKVNQKADPSVMPDDAAIGAELDRAVDALMRRPTSAKN
jgi:hypothetical protein